MPVVIGAALVVAAGATVYSAVEQKKAADSAAATSTAVAGYNARLDRAESEQLDLDTQANIAAMRKDAATYMSRQTSAYAASGVMANTGSPLVARAATAGALELQMQQKWTDLNAHKEMLESKAQAGVAEGQAQADQYHMQGTAAVMNGAAKVASMAASAYGAGVFGSAGSNTSTALSGNWEGGGPSSSIGGEGFQG